MSPWQVLLMATAAGLAVASNYYAQPLLHSIGLSFGMSAAETSLIVTVAQVGTAAGLWLLVPLGDMLERRRLIVTMILCSSASLTAVALAPDITMVLAAAAIAAASSVVAQIILPMAATLASPHEQGKVVGTVLGGLLLGILLARTAAGALADLGGWRMVYGIAAALAAAVALALWRGLPRQRGDTRSSYPALLASVPLLFVQEPHFRARSLLGALCFAQFIVLWTALTFLLSGPGYGYSDTAIGLFGLAGAAGAWAARPFGRLVDRGHADRCTALCLWLLVLSWVLLAQGGTSLAALIAGILALDLAAQGISVTNQGCIYRLRPEARSRLTAGYMMAYFTGGAGATLLSGVVHAYAGWTGVTVLGATLALLAVIYEAVSPHARVPRTAPGLLL
jgi:predicted MFS family arabinose efflux permease